MSETPEALVRRWFEELWNQSREDTIDQLLSHDAVVHGLPTPDGKPLTGPDGFRGLYRQFRSAFPDMKIKVTRAISQGDQCAVHVEARGTHSGDGLGVAATHRPVHFAGIVIIRARDGKLVEGLNAFDFLSLYQQIGLVPPMGQTISL
jgi:steroid delta-isomerase-like uncharacterized protein